MKSNTIVLILATLIIAAGAYWFFLAREGNEPPLTAGPQVSQAQLEFQTLLGELQPISFNTSIFLDPRFAALVDLTTPIAPETAGRLDPFAPVPGISGR